MAEVGEMRRRDNLQKGARDADSRLQHVHQQGKNSFAIAGSIDRHGPYSRHPCGESVAMAQLSTSIKPEYLTARQVSKMTGFSMKALETMRHRRRGPRYFKVGVLVRYRAGDIRAWIEQGEAAP